MEQQTITFIKNILNKCHITFDDFSQLHGLILPRDLFLNNITYELIKPDILLLKQVLSSSSMTSLQHNAHINQKWPLLNLVRQLLKAVHLQFIPIRKSNGYTKNGTKIYKRFFQIPPFSHSQT
jgi:hypothetical protein